MVQIMTPKNTAGLAVEQEEVKQEGLVPEEGTPVVEDKDTATPDTAEYVKVGKEVLANTDLSQLGKDVRDLEFVACLIDNKTRGNAKRNGIYEKMGVLRGFRLKNNSDRVIKYTFSKLLKATGHSSTQEGIAVGSGYDIREAKPGEEFDLGIYDAFTLINQPRYGGHLYAPSLALDKKLAKNTFIVFSTKKKLTQGANFPSVVYNVVVVGAKDTFEKGAGKKTIAIKDQRIYLFPHPKGVVYTEPGTPIKPEFEEQFGILTIKKPKAERTPGAPRQKARVKDAQNGITVRSGAIGLAAVLANTAGIDELG